MQRSNNSSHSQSFCMQTNLISILFIILTNPCTTIKLCHAQKFEPYVLNGGLVSAVAGPDFVIIASDTRLSQGYEILTRNHLSSRLWSVVSHGRVHADECASSENENDGLYSSLIHDDGSVCIPSKPTSKQILKFHSPTFIASAGCASDCEALKRQMRYEMNSHVNWNYGLDTMTPSGIANVLGQTLYSRRGFPFYSFCILAGISSKKTSGHGVVHTYDAIGSHECVAVATAGTGREMLQPILDRLFSSTSSADTKAEDRVTKKKESIQRDGLAVNALKQRVGLKLKPPVETFVSCDVDEAVSLLVRGYKSVAEREIAVGDNIVVCVVKRCEDEENIDEEHCSLQVLRFPLKQH